MRDHGRFGVTLRTPQASEFQLFDLQADLAESTDLAAAHTDVDRELKQRHLAWLRPYVTSQ